MRPTRSARCRQPRRRDQFWWRNWPPRSRRSTTNWPVRRAPRHRPNLDTQITERFACHENADVLLSLPGFGAVLAATFLANIGGNLDGFDFADRLAGVAGLAPFPRDSGRIRGNLSSASPLQSSAAPNLLLRSAVELEEQSGVRAFYDQKRSEEKSHKRALIAFALHRINVIWAMLRDRTMYTRKLPLSPGLLLLDNSIETPNSWVLHGPRSRPADRRSRSCSACR
ncbi:transposase [Rhodococcus sp. BH5]|uniref:transposase n=1 Tax=Rhodococcus sp. BH5 TaxID=2871702 RepID=UPI003FA7399B